MKSFIFGIVFLFGCTYALWALVSLPENKSIKKECSEVNEDPQIIRCEFEKEICYYIKGSYGVYTISCFTKQ